MATTLSVSRISFPSGHSFKRWLDPDYTVLPSARGSLPIVLDINGDMKPDLLGYSWDTKDTNTNELSMWVNTAEPTALNSTSLYNM